MFGQSKRLEDYPKHYNTSYQPQGDCKGSDQRDRAIVHCWILEREFRATLESKVYLAIQRNRDFEGRKGRPARRAKAIVDNLPASIEYIRAGKLRALAVGTTTRSDSLPDIPTVADYFPGYDASAWIGVAIPRKTPASAYRASEADTRAWERALRPKPCRLARHAKRPSCN